LDKWHLNDAAGTNHGDLAGATVTAANLHTPAFTITMTEAQRVATLKISGTSGGNGDAVVLDCDAGALTDMANEAIAEDDGNVVVETEDETRPVVLSATIDYNAPVREMVVYVS
jgi:hypothetical protein